MKTERVDDIPLLIAELGKSNLSEHLLQSFPDHGNWSGISGGKVTVGFLTYVLSCGDHRLSRVEDWASNRLMVLRHCLKEKELTAKDFTDDRLGAILDKFSDSEKWNEFESAHNQEIIQIYNLDLKNEPIRLDAMITQSFREAGEAFKYGHSKQHRADLPQLKTMVATLDPLAMPLYSITVSGNTADDVLYRPVLKKMIENLPLTNQLFVGDAKLSSVETRAYLHKNEHYYLSPLGRKQCTPEQLAQYLIQKPKELVTLVDQEKDKTIIKAQGFELLEEVYSEEQDLTWQERRLVVFSPVYAKKQEAGLIQRLEKAELDLSFILERKQGRKLLRTTEEVAIKVNKILDKQRVSNFIKVEIKETQTKTKQRQFVINVSRNLAQVDKHIQRLGWRVYACNAPIHRLNTTQAIECYRNEYRIEHKFNELLNKVTMLTPVYLQKPERIKALIRLLLLALKFSSLIQFQVRNILKTTKQKIKELYPGNPGRVTDKPTTNLLLRVFDNINLVCLKIENKVVIQVSTLKPRHLKILKYLKIPPESYLSLNNSPFSHFELGEP